MNNTQYFIYLLIMAGSTYLIRAVPFSLLTKKIENKYIKSFLYYIPYAVLSAMTIPAALFATETSSWKVQMNFSVVVPSP